MEHNCGKDCTWSPAKQFEKFLERHSEFCPWVQRLDAKCELRGGTLCVCVWGGGLYLKMEPWDKQTFRENLTYKVVQIWQGLMSPDIHTNSPGHIWTTFYLITFRISIQAAQFSLIVKLPARQQLRQNTNRLLPFCHTMSRLFTRQCASFLSGHFRSFFFWWIPCNFILIFNDSKI